MKSRKRAIGVSPLYALSAILAILCSAGCSRVQPQPAATPTPEIHPPPAPLMTPAIRSRPARLRRPYIRKPPEPPANPPLPAPPPVPAVTLESNEDAKAKARRSLDQATATLAHLNRAELPQSTASTYQQASELIDAAHRALADQDYVAASSLAEKASALLSQLPSRK